MSWSCPRRSATPIGCGCAAASRTACSHPVTRRASTGDVISSAAISSATCRCSLRACPPKPSGDCGQCLRTRNLLVDLLLVRRLRPWAGNVGKRLVRTPKVYIRDSGLTHALLDIETWEDVLGHPVAGTSWEGFVVENLITAAGDGARRTSIEPRTALKSICSSSEAGSRRSPSRSSARLRRRSRAAFIARAMCSR